MIPVKLVEDLAPRLTFLDEFVSRCPITTNFFPSTPTSARWGESDCLLCDCQYCCQDECTHENPSTRMSILALKGRCLAMCLYSNSIVLESKKKSFFFWNAWVSKSEHSRHLRKAKVVAAKKRFLTLCSTSFRAWHSVTSMLRNLRNKKMILAGKSKSALRSRVMQAWRNTSLKSIVDDDLIEGVKACKRDSRKTQHSPRQLSACIIKSQSRKFRIGTSALKSMPMKFLLMYGASLSRIVRTWAEFSWQQRLEILNRVRCQHRYYLTCVMRSWIDAYKNVETKIFVQQFRGAKDLKIDVFNRWRDACREGWKQVVFDLFEQRPDLDTEDKSYLPSVHDESMPDMFKQNLIALGQMQFRITRKALDSWKEELNRIFSIKMMINNSRRKQARQVLDLWYQATGILSEERDAALKMVNPVKQLGFVLRKWRASVSVCFTALDKRKWSMQAQSRLDRLVRTQFRKWRNKVLLSHFYSQRDMPYGVLSLLKRSNDRSQQAAFHGWLHSTWEMKTVIFQSRQASINKGEGIARRDTRILQLAIKKMRHIVVEITRRNSMKRKLAFKIAFKRIRSAVIAWSDHCFASKIFQHISSKISKVHDVGVYSRTLNSWYISVLNIRKLQNIILAQRKKGRTLLLTKFFSEWLLRERKKSLVMRRMSMIINARHLAIVGKYMKKFRVYTYLTHEQLQLKNRTEIRRRRKRLIQTFQIFFEHSKMRTECSLVWVHQRMRNKLTLLSILLRWQFCADSSLATLECIARKYHFRPRLYAQCSAQKHRDTRACTFEAWEMTTLKHSKLLAIEKSQVHKLQRRKMLHVLRAWLAIWLDTSNFRGTSCALVVRCQFRQKNQTIKEWRKVVAKSRRTKNFIRQTTAMISHRVSCRAWITWILKTSSSAEVFHHADVLYYQKQRAVVFRVWISWMMHTNSAVAAREQLKALNAKQMIVPKAQPLRENNSVDAKVLPSATGIAFAESALESFVKLSGSANPDDDAQKCKLLDTISQRQSHRLLTTAVVEWHNVASVRASSPRMPRIKSSSFIVSC
jgi:hypothetical protein